MWSPWRHKESDMTEQLNNNLHLLLYEFLWSEHQPKNLWSAGTWLTDPLGYNGWNSWNGQSNQTLQPPLTKSRPSNTLAWKIPWTEEPGGLQSTGLRRVGHDWATSLRLFTFTHWRRKWQPTLVFLPGESQGQGSLVGCCLWGRTESDTTEAT